MNYLNSRIRGFVVLFLLAETQFCYLAVDSPEKSFSGDSGGGEIDNIIVRTEISRFVFD